MWGKEGKPFAFVRKELGKDWNPYGHKFKIDGIQLILFLLYIKFTQIKFSYIKDNKESQVINQWCFTTNLELSYLKLETHFAKAKKKC